MPALTLEMLQQNPTPFAAFLGLKIVEASPDRVVGELIARPELGTTPTTMHGGAIMAVADNLGAVGTFLNLPDGHTTATVESKTNFLAGIPIGDTVRAEATPINLGRTLHVWQTRVYRQDGRLAALVIQSQIVRKVG